MSSLKEEGTDLASVHRTLVWNHNDWLL